MQRRLAVSLGVLVVCALPYACGGSRHVSTPTNHRPVAPAACTPQSISSFPCSGSGTPACAMSSDCTAGVDGSCIAIADVCSCTYDVCLTDDDCGPGNDCACNGRDTGGAGYSGTRSTTVCVASNCRLDSDCGPGGFCSPSRNGVCGSVAGFYCHTSHDECGDDTDCTGSVNACVYSPEVGHWICSLGGGCGGG